MANSTTPVETLPFTLPENYQQAGNPFHIIPAELVRACLFSLDVKSLLNTSRVCKVWYVAVTLDAQIWEAMKKSLNLDVVSPVTKSSFQISYIKHCSYSALYQTLKLEENFGREVYQKIKDLPEWKEPIKWIYNEDDDLDFSQFPLQTEKDKTHHFYKAKMDDDLYLILIDANRWKSKVIWFNSAFNLNSTCEKEYIYWEYGLSVSTGFYVNTRDSHARKQIELELGWDTIKSTLCQYFDIKTKPLNGTQIELGILTSDGFIDLSNLYLSNDD